MMKDTYSPSMLALSNFPKTFEFPHCGGLNYVSSYPLPNPTPQEQWREINELLLPLFISSLPIDTQLIFVIFGGPL